MRQSPGAYPGRVASAPPAPRRSRPATAAIIVIAFVALLWVIEIAGAVLPVSLDGFGIVPRSVDGLSGILSAPLLHVGFGHLIANSGPLLVLGFVLFLSGTRTAVAATVVIWLIAGVGTWLTGAPGSVHLGASGVVFGWIVYLVVRGFVTRHWVEIVVGVIVLAVYGGVLWGALPGTPGVSWQSHLFGAVGGAIAAFAVARPGASRAQR